MPVSTPGRPRSASTGSPGSRASGGVAQPPPPAREALDELDQLEADVIAEVAAIGSTGDEARRLAGSVRETLGRHRRDRSRLRRELGLVPGLPAAAPEERAPDLEALRAAQEALVFATAEAVGRVGGAEGGVLVDQLRAVAAHLAVTELWIEREQR